MARPTVYLLLSLFAIALALPLAVGVADHRERDCAKQCRLQGYAGYSYKLFDGRLDRDNCSCLNKR